MSKRSIATIARILEIRYANNLYYIGRMRIVNVVTIRSAARITAEILHTYCLRTSDRMLVLHRHYITY